MTGENGSPADWRSGFLATSFLMGEVSHSQTIIGVVMREDMNKVIVERSRRGKYGDDRAAKRRNDFEGPTFSGMRAGYGYRSLNENLAPLRRYLRAQVGRPWNNVFSEICAGIDGHNTVQQHIRQHIDDFIATKVELRNEELVDLHDRWRSYRATGGCDRSSTSIHDRV